MRQVVKRFFDRPGLYLSSPAYLRARAELALEMCGPRGGRDVLDAGCGDGSMSIPLLESGDRVTFADSSEPMLALARDRVAAVGNRSLARFVQTDVLELGSDSRYDLILALGLMAHVERPDEVIRRLAELLRPGGRMVLQFTDARHPLGRLLFAYDRLRESLVPTRGYPLARLTLSEALSTASEAGLSIEECRRYSCNLPGLRRLMGEDRLLRLERAVRKNSALRWLAADCMISVARVQ